ncbi:MAG: flagellar assembly protein FliW [Actinomycetota bacterium]|nr:flagellar assembly protein FliW [Actinomycetota bacterium]
MMETNLAGRSTECVEITFAAGLPGFPDAHRFQLTPWGSTDTPFTLMTSADDPEVGFVVVPPWVFYPEYEFDLDDGATDRLALSEPEDAVVFCVVTLKDKPEDATMNLLGPIVVNRHTLEAAQIVLPASGYSVRAPLAIAS